MDSKVKTNPFFVLFLVMLASAATFLIAHEATHLLLASKATGVCFGICQANSESTVVGIAYAQHNEWSKREDIPSAIGIGTAIVVCLVGIMSTIDLAFQSSD